MSIVRVEEVLPQGWLKVNEGRATPWSFRHGPAQERVDVIEVLSQVWIEKPGRCGWRWALQMSNGAAWEVLFDVKKQHFELLRVEVDAP